MKNILFVTNLEQPFIERDRIILRKEWKIIDFPCYINNYNKLSALINIIRQIYFTPFYLLKCRILFIEFVGYHSLIPLLWAKLLNKKSIIVPCGTDSYSIPEINYGNFRKQPLAICTKLSYLLANYIIPVDISLSNQKYTYINTRNDKQGFIPLTKNKIFGKIIEIENGYYLDKFYITKPFVEREEKSFLTVATGIELQTIFLRKGIDLIYQAAKYFPEYKFYIVGVKDSSSLPIPPSNLILIGYVKNEMLNSIYNSCQYYFQLSIAEGFPNALCEAMLAGLVPIGSNVAAIPKIINKHGYILSRKDLDELIQIIKSLNKDKDEINSFESSNFIKNNFPYSKREDKILKLLREI